MAAVTVRVPLHPTMADGGHPSLHIGPGIILPPISASVRSIAVRLGLARPTELVTVARRHDVLDAAGEAICGLDASYLWARAMPAAEFLVRSEWGLLAEPPPTPSGPDVDRSLRKPVELPPEEIYDSVRAALSADGADEPSVRGLGFDINEPAQFILDNLACLANISGPTARAWSWHCRT